MLIVKILTPTHIGTGKEKDLLEGVDFLMHNNNIHFPDLDKMVKEFNITPDDLANAVEHRNGINELLRIRNIAPEMISSRSIKADEFTVSEIKTHIRDGMGRSYLPGSSLKGALRSVIVNKAILSGYSREQINNYLTRNRNNRRANVERDLLEVNIQNDPLRHLKVPDIYFGRTDIGNTKIFNLFQMRNGLTGGWKHAHNRTDDRFSPRGFTTSYEYIVPGQTASLQIKYDTATGQQRSGLSPVIYALTNARDPDAELIGIIKKYTRTYLERERNFFYTYYANEEETDDHILPAFDKLIKLNETEGTALLRIGAGSGFHAMTGDWKYDYYDGEFERDGSHYAAINYIQNFEPQDRGREVLLKSRKLMFSRNENGDFDFTPMGFVSLKID